MPGNCLKIPQKLNETKINLNFFRIAVPERIRNQGQLLHRNPLHIAFEKIKTPLLNYAVHNRANTFVYK